MKLLNTLVLVGTLAFFLQKMDSNFYNYSRNTLDQATRDLRNCITKVEVALHKSFS
jgi:hypothetical protein